MCMDDRGRSGVIGRGGFLEPLQLKENLGRFQRGRVAR